jgi:hypothetical protein
MASGRSCSPSDRDGIRRTVNGKTLAPRSKRKTERTFESCLRWTKDGDKWHQFKTVIERNTSLLFLD